MKHRTKKEEAHLAETVPVMYMTSLFHTIERYKFGKITDPFVILQTQKPISVDIKVGLRYFEKDLCTYFEKHNYVGIIRGDAHMEISLYCARICRAYTYICNKADDQAQVHLNCNDYSVIDITRLG